MTELNSDTFLTAIQSRHPVVVDFWADWCMPCKIFAPIMESLADELDGQAEFCKVNLDENNDLAQQYGITHIPTVLVFKEGELVDRSMGSLPKEKIAEMVRKHI